MLLPYFIDVSFLGDSILFWMGNHKPLNNSSVSARYRLANGNFSLKNSPLLNTRQIVLIDHITMLPSWDAAS